MPFKISYSGALTHCAFDQYAREHVFRPARVAGSGDDFSRLGWEIVPSRTTREVHVDKVEMVTAEGLAVLAATLDALRSDSDVTLMGNAAELPGLCSPERFDTSRHFRFESFGDDALLLPVLRVDLAESSDCALAAAAIASAIGSVEIDGFRGSIVAEALALSLREIFTNVLIHSTKSYAFLSAVIQPSSRFGDDESSREFTWIARETTPIVEVCVSDTGCGVPFRLGREFSRRHPKDWEAFVRSIVRTRPFWEQRGAVHERICQWAFAHDSTSSANHEHSTRGALNWRGLHRAFSYVVWHHGAITMRSGQARVGLLASTDLVEPLSTISTSRAEYPGTTVVVRLRAAANRPDHEVHRSEEHLPLGSLTMNPWPDTQSGLRAFGRAVSERALARDFEYCIVHTEPPSATLPNDASSVEGAIEPLPGNVVGVHLFSEVAASALASLLAAAGSATSADGVPRLLCCWDPELGARWAFAGLVPVDVDGTLRRLAAEGYVSDDAVPPSAAAVLAELQLHYPNRLSRRDGIWELVGFQTAPEIDVIRVALQLVLKRQSLESLGAVYDAGPDAGVRLSTRTLVRRYLSATALVEGSSTTRAVLRTLLAAELGEIARAHGEFVIYPTSLAAYYLFRILSRELRTPSLRVAKAGTTWVDGPLVPFTTAVHSGATLQRTIDHLQRRGMNVLRSVAVLDLRRPPPASSDPALTCLVPLDFDPQPIAASTQIAREQTVCAVTDWPVAVPDDAGALAYDPLGSSLIGRTPSPLRYGLQVLEGRVHVVTLPVANLPPADMAVLREWICRAVSEQLPSRDSQVVFFIRREATPYDQLHSIVDMLQGGRAHAVQAIRVTLPSVTRGRRTIYGLSAAAMFDGALELAQQGSLITRPRLQPGFVAVYVDNAAVTGGGLRAFVEAVTSAPTEPGALLAIPLVNRLSPSEESLLRHTMDFGYPAAAPEVDRARVRFTFRPLFRLQIRSHEHVAQTGFAGTLREFADAHLDFDNDVRAYVLLLSQRRDALDRSLRSPQLGHEPLTTPLSHPFSELRPDADVTTPSIIQFRQLLSLHHQNQGVLPVLLQRFADLVAQRAYGLLSVFAVEPDLLELHPLAVECWNDVMGLAIDALEHTPDDHVASDAIAVLSNDGAFFCEAMAAIIHALRNHPILERQVLAFTGLVIKRSPVTATVIRRELGNMVDARGGQHVNRVESFVRSVIATASLELPAAADALDAIYQLCARFYRHSVSYEIWVDMAHHLAGLPREEPTRGWDETIRLGLDLARGCFIPTLLGLATMAHDDGNAASERDLRFAARRAAAATETLDVEWRGKPRNPSRLRSNLDVLRACTVTQTPDRFMSVVGTAGPYELSTIERYMPDVVCAPLNVVQSHLSYWKYQPCEETALPYGYSDLTSDFIPDYLLLVGGQHAALIELLSILRRNYERHGVVDTLRVGFAFADDGELFVRFTNQRDELLDENSDPYSGRGLPYASDVAEAAGAILHIDNSEEETFSVSLSFLKPLRIEFARGIEPWTV